VTDSTKVVVLHRLAAADARADLRDATVAGALTCAADVPAVFDALADGGSWVWVGTRTAQHCRVWAPTFAAHPRRRLEMVA
jgi:hypothetical protein